VAGQDSGSEGGGIDIVEASFDVQEEGGDFQPGFLEGFYLQCKGEAGVTGAKPGAGAALVRVEDALGLGDGRHPDRHHPFEDLRDSFKEDNDTEGAEGVVGGLAGLS